MRRKTTLEFIRDARAVHGDKYNYDKVDYVNAITPVIITCPKHGDFPQLPNNHTNNGEGCPECATERNIQVRRMTNEEFINKAKAVHGDKYDYSLVDIKGNNKTKVKIKCNVCGNVFLQQIHAHLNGQGCSKCVGNKKLTKEEFITKAKEKHGDKYDYSLVEIDGNNKTKVKIKCNTCSTVFEQRIKNHLRGQGCPCCAENKKKTTDEFMEEARLVHGNKYSYDKVVYRGDKEKVIITCPIHGDFPQTPSSHKHGQGCPECKKEKLSKLHAMTIEEFIAKARGKHGNKYDYSLVNHSDGDRSKVKIKCNKCGAIFEQRIWSHLSGCGCPQCSHSHLEEQTRILLEKSNIIYDPQKKFPWLKNKREMPLDFYLPEHNIAIECQGKQHYKASKRGFFYRGNGSRN